MPVHAHTYEGISRNSRKMVQTGSKVHNGSFLELISLFFGKILINNVTRVKFTVNPGSVFSYINQA